MQNKPQLFCFTFAGGTSDFFCALDSLLSDIDVVGLEYAGHGTRRKEPFYNDFDELADDMYCEIKKHYRGGDYALFGYSMGSISLVETLKRILDRGEIRPPVRLFLAAHEPMTKAELADYSLGMNDELVKERTIGFGAVPEKLMNNRSFWRMYLPIYRADYTVIGKYRFEDLILKSDIPTYVFYSQTDTRFEDMKLWRYFFTGECVFYRFDGTHFFMQEHCSEISTIIASAMSNCRRSINHDI